MDCLDLVPSFKRQLKKYVQAEDTDSKLAGYLSDGIKSLAFRWSREYTITSPSSESFIVTPSVVQSDERPIILASSIIYKSSLLLGSFRDGDFAYDVPAGANNPIQRDIDELKILLPVLPGKRLVAATVSSLNGFDNWYNPESYKWLGYFAALV